MGPCMGKRFVQGGAICSHKVVCFDLWGNTEICLGTLLSGLDTFASSKEAKGFRGLLAEFGGQWDLVGGVHLVEDGMSLGLGEMGEWHHPFSRDHTEAVSGAGRWKMGLIEEDLTPAFLDHYHLIDVR